MSAALLTLCPLSSAPLLPNSLLRDLGFLAASNSWAVALGFVKVPNEAMLAFPSSDIGGDLGDLPVNSSFTAAADILFDDSAGDFEA